MRRHRLAPLAGLAAVVLMLAAVTSNTGPVMADGAPTPNPLTNPPKNPVYAPLAGDDLTANGPAATMHGDPLAGRTLFALNCTTCHNQRGVGGISNPGSDDGAVPSLSPIDPGFFDAANGDPAGFIRAIDLFVQHGSRPAGSDPIVNMIGWGDHQLLSQQDLANIEAYIIRLNGMYWPDRFVPPAEVQMTVDRSATDPSSITYRIMLINQSADALRSLTLRDQLPPRVLVSSTYAGAIGLNPATITGNTVEWNNVGIPQGETLGPFVIVAQAQDANAAIDSNTSSLAFSWSSWDGKTSAASVDSNAVAVAAPAPAIAAAPPPAAAVAAQIVEPSVGALSWGFSPDTVTVKVGDSITWTNSGSLQHSATADDGSFNSGLLTTAQTFTQTFTTAGTFTYHCTPHPWMKATVVVQGS
jgi:plastocyanin